MSKQRTRLRLTSEPLRAYLAPGERSRTRSHTSGADALQIPPLCHPFFFIFFQDPCIYLAILHNGDEAEMLGVRSYSHGLYSHGPW